MRRSLILTVAASVSMVLLAMLVPTAVLLHSYALEDRVSRAALEVQATETVVSGQDRGAVSTYLDRVNRRHESTTTVLYPPSGTQPDGDAIGPDPDQDTAVAAARSTGRASLRDRGADVEILVPVALGGSSAAASDTPVVRVMVHPPGLESAILRSWLVLLTLGLLLLGGALLLADRLGRSFVVPIRRLAGYAAALGERRRPDAVEPTGPAEVRDLTVAMNQLVSRIEALLQRERAGVADISHQLRTPMTALRLRIETLRDDGERNRMAADLDDLQAMVDHVVRQVRRSEHESVVAHSDAAKVVAERVRFWAPLAEDQGRPLELRVVLNHAAPVGAFEEELVALVDVLLDNVFTYTADDAPVVVELLDRDGGGVVLRVDDAGPGLPADVDVSDRGASGAGSTGLGLAIVEQTATRSGGGLSLSTSPLGGARVEVHLGPAAVSG